MDLSKDIMMDLGITVIGDIIAILKHAKQVYRQVSSVLSSEALKQPAWTVHFQQCRLFKKKIPVEYLHYCCGCSHGEWICGCRGCLTNESHNGLSLYNRCMCSPLQDMCKMATEAISSGQTSVKAELRRTATTRRCFTWLMTLFCFFHSKTKFPAAYLALLCYVRSVLIVI